LVQTKYLLTRVFGEADIGVLLLWLFFWVGYLTVPGLREMDGSTRSSLSEASGVSGASTRTYVNEASTLVLETIENGVKK
jgi:hypothetical protein